MINAKLQSNLLFSCLFFLVGGAKKNWHVFVFVVVCNFAKILPTVLQQQQ